MKSLSKRKYLGSIVGAVGAASLAVGVLMATAAIASMERSVVYRSQAEPGVMALSWRKQIDTASKLTATLQAQPYLIGFLEDPANAFYGYVSALQLGYYQSVLQAEFAVMLNTTGHIVSTPYGTPDTYMGLKWDPANIVLSSMSNAVGYTRTGLVNVSQLTSFGAPRFNGVSSTSYNTHCATGQLLRYSQRLCSVGSMYDTTLFPDTPVSKLHPYDTGAESLIRWTSTPLFTTATYDKTDLDDRVVAGVQAYHASPFCLLLVLLLHAHPHSIVSGGIVNGKTKIVERANDVISRGYSAIYYTNSTGDMVLGASVLRLNKGSFEVDVELPTTTWLDKLRYSKEWTRVPVSVSAYMHLNGGKYLMSAHCIPVNTKFDIDGFNPDLTSTDGQPLKDCPAFLIQGLPRSLVEPILLSGQIGQTVVHIPVSDHIRYVYVCAHQQKFGVHPEATTISIE
eukprot:21328-Heterococcus_DN1.PRE.6